MSSSEAKVVLEPLLFHLLDDQVHWLCIQVVDGGFEVLGRESLGREGLSQPLVGLVFRKTVSIVESVIQDGSLLIEALPVRFLLVQKVEEVMLVEC